VVAALRRREVSILVGTRGHRGAGAAPGGYEERHLRFHESLTEEDWRAVLENVDVVVNAVGILRERYRESFDAVHHRAAGALARACAKRNIRLVHVSALGIDGPVRCEFSRSKLRGESAIQKSGCRGAIVRASVVDAPDGYGSGWFHRLSRWPVWLLPAAATHLLSPVAAIDLGEALAELAIGKRGCHYNTIPASVIDVGCGENFTLETYLNRLRRAAFDRAGKMNYCEPMLKIRIPQSLARACAHLFDALRITPYSVGHDELLGSDNVPRNNKLQDILGRRPCSIGLCEKHSPKRRVGSPRDRSDGREAAPLEEWA